MLDLISRPILVVDSELKAELAIGPGPGVSLYLLHEDTGHP